MFIPKLPSFEVKSIELIVTHSSLVNSKDVLRMMIFLLVSPINLIFGFISTPYSDMTHQLFVELFHVQYFGEFQLSSVD